jgi:hypothetical protein
MQNADRTEIWRYGDTIFCFRKLAEYTRGFQLVARVVYMERVLHKTATHHKMVPRGVFSAAQTTL